MGDHLNSATHQGGDQKNFTHTVGGSLKNCKTFQRPSLPVKNDTSLMLNIPVLHGLLRVNSNAKKHAQS